MAPTDKTRLINYCGLCVRSQWKGQGGVEWLPVRSDSIAELIYIITKKQTRKGELKSGITGIILACNFPSNCRIALQLIFFSTWVIFFFSILHDGPPTLVFLPFASLAGCSVITMLGGLRCDHSVMPVLIEVSSASVMFLFVCSAILREIICVTLTRNLTEWVFPLLLLAILYKKIRYLTYHAVETVLSLSEPQRCLNQKGTGGKLWTVRRRSTHRWFSHDKFWLAEGTNFCAR